MSLRDYLERVFHLGPDREALLEEEAQRRHQATFGGIPVEWRDEEGGYRGVTDARVQLAGPEELDAYGDPRVVTCGSCKYFDLKNGQKEMMRQRFAERLVHDEGWKLHHLGAPLEMNGLCGASGGDMATTFVTKACDQYVPVERLRRR